ncbi:NSE4 Non-structural maintenance of chromosome element 4 [Candida maltosa Xu316]
MEDNQPRRRKYARHEQIEEYERLRQRIKNNFKDAVKGQAMDLSLNYIDEIAEIYNRVQTQKTKDTSVHREDSEVFKETSKFAALNARNMKFDDSALTLDEWQFFKCLKKYAITDPSLLTSADMDITTYDQNEDDDDDDIVGEQLFNQTNWLKLGILYHQVSKKAISVDFLNGPLKTEKRKVTRTRNVDDTKSIASATTARQVQASDISGNEEQNTANMVKMVYRTYLEKDEGQETNLFRFFINPTSFGQSIENLFYTSFLVKDGRLKLYLNDYGVPCIQRVSNDEIRQAQMESNKIMSSHHIATFNYGAWKKYIDTYSIEDAFLGHRNEPEDQMPADDLIDDFIDEPIQVNNKKRKLSDSE